MDGIEAYPDANNGMNQNARVGDAPENGVPDSNGPQSDHINNAQDAPATPQQPMGLTFRDQNGFALTFKLKATTRLGKAMDHFSARSEKARESLRFLFEGERIIADSTPADVGLEDGDVVEVHMEQIGGRGGRGN